jgi:hypothetical protein
MRYYLARYSDGNINQGAKVEAKWTYSNGRILSDMCWWV